MHSREAFVVVYLLLFDETDSLPFIAGAGKSILWYDKILISSPWVLIQLFSSSIIQDIDAMRNLGWPRLHSFIVTLGKIRKGIGVGYSCLCWSNFVTSLTLTATSCQNSMWDMPVVHKIRATMHLSSV